MKRFSLYILLVVVGVFFLGTVQASAQKKMKKETVAMTPEDLKWEAMQGGPPGVMTAALWGDQTKGAYAVFTKFPAGFKAPLHHHTNAIKAVVVKGGYTYKGKVYGPGSYLSIPAGDMHESGGVADSETIFYMEQPGKFDLIPAEAPAEKK